MNNYDREATASKEENLLPEDSVKFLSFFLAQERFAVDLAIVSEIRGYQNIKIVAAPSALPFLIGIFNLNEEIIPIVDLRILLQLKDVQYNDKTVVIILIIKGKKYGVIVDTVFDIISLDSAKIKIAPNHYAKIYVSRVGVIDKDMFLILDMERLLEDKDIGLV